jgi:hypothetical protein
VLFPAVWASVHKFTLHFHATSEQVRTFVNVAGQFWSRWVEAAEPLLVARWKRLLHCAAIFLTTGAIIGMYIRGLFLEYRVVWASTFVTDENTVSRLVDSVFGPAMLLADIAGLDLRSGIDTGRLMGPGGDAAAAWIHLFALTALLIIIVPRSLLAGFQWFHARRAAGAIQIDFDDYFAARIRPQIGKLMAAEIEPAIKRFAESMAGYVCKELYDSRIVPELAQFRENGGRINDLKERIKERCEEFRDEIRAYGGAATKELEASVANGLERVMSVVQHDFRLPAATKEDLSGGFKLLPSQELHHPLRPIGSGITDAVSIAVSASMAVALGTVAGGFGESLEVAIIVALFGTTGPVGFLIGAVIGLIVGAGAWWLGREKITERVDNISLPGRVVRMALWQSRFDKLIQEGRTKCYELVKTRAGDLLSPLASQIASEVWIGLERLWKARSNAESTNP